MALIYADGFDHWGTPAEMIASGTWIMSPGILLNNGNPRTGTNALYGDTLTFNYSTLVLPSSFNEGGCGFALYYTAQSDVLGVVFQGGGQEMLAVSLRKTGTPNAIQICKYPYENLATSAAGIVPIGSYFYLEVGLKRTQGNTNTLVEVRLNGTPVVAWEGPIVWTTDQIRIGRTFSGGGDYGEYWFDDLVVWNRNGLVNNDFMGIRSCFTLLPNSDQTPQQWISTDPAGYQAIDNVPPDNTHYIAGVNVGDQSAFGMSKLPNTASAIGGMVVFERLNLSASGVAKSVSSVTDNTGTQYNPERAPGTSPQWYRNVFQTKANNVPWSRDDVNAVSVGIVKSA